ncbi:MAG: SpoIIE family protein phosphatase [Sphingobacteriaceae bacterium]|nr:SpoIIE family protein phosphatase [Sphingobacteriaceae bacterium]
MFSGKIFLFIFTLILFNRIDAQLIYSAANEVNFKRYSIEEGLNGKNIFSVYQDKSGFLWVPSSLGLSRFDGLHFKNFSKKDGIPGSVVANVIQDKNKVLWVGSNRGTIIYKDRKFIKYDSAHVLTKCMMLCSLEDKDSTIWIGYSNGVLHIDPDKIDNPVIKHYKLGTGPQNIIRCLSRNIKGELVAGSESGIYAFRKDSFMLYTPHRCMGFSFVIINDSTEWACGWGSDVNEFVNGKHKRMISLGSPIMSITKVANDQIWLASWDKGVFKYDGNSFIHYNNEQGLEYGSFWGCYTDNGGNVWFSSWGKGLFKFSGERFTKLTDKSGLVNNNVIGIHKAPDGKIWFTSENGLMYVDPLNNNFKKKLTEFDGNKMSKIMCSVIRPNNEVLALGYGGYGYRINNDKISLDPKMYGFAVINDRNNDLIIGLESNGAVRHRNGGVIDSIKLNIYNRDLNTYEKLYEDKKNNLWLFIFFKGVNYYNGKTTINFSQRRGFINDPATAVCDDIKGNYWIGTRGRGVFKWVFISDTLLEIKDSITEFHGLLTDNINSLHIVKNKLLIGTDKGLNIMDLKRYNYDGSKTIRSYGKGEGFINSETDVAFCEENGSAWIKTDQGAYFYDPRFDEINTTETRTHILSIKLFLKDVDWSQYSKTLNNESIPTSLKLSYDNDHLTFSYIGICLASPLNVKYQYKLEGLDKNWSPVTEVHEAAYSSIPPGTYTFMVRSCNNDDQWNKTPTTFVFTITPPFWKTIWFNIIIIISVIAGIITYIRLRERKLKAEKLLLEDKVTARTIQLKDALAQVEEKQKEILDSIKYAKRLQKAILTSEKTLRSVFEQSFILFKPKDIVSGDFYWMVHLEEKSINKNTFVFAAADCTGHGVPGAFMSMLNSTLLNQTVYNPNIMTPADVLNFMNTELPKNLRTSDDNDKIQDGMDIAFGIIDINNNLLKFCGANNPCWIIRDGALIELAPIKQAITATTEYEKRTFIDQEVPLKKGDCIYMFTDGYADQFGGPKGKKYKYKTLANQLLSLNKETMQRQKQALEENFENWKGQLEQVDDVCIIGIRI